MGFPTVGVVSLGVVVAACLVDGQSVGWVVEAEREVWEGAETTRGRLVNVPDDKDGGMRLLCALVGVLGNLQSGGDFRKQ